MNSGKAFYRTRLRGGRGGSSSRRRGSAVVLVVSSMSVMAAMAAMTIDLGYLHLARQELQMSADSGALAAIWTLRDKDGNLAADYAVSQATGIAALNSSDGIHELTFGWIADISDPSSPFTPTTPDVANAVLVTSRRSAASGNPVELFFSGIFGKTQSDVVASAVAVYAPVEATDTIPVALRAPGFGPVDPDIVIANPGKDGPSEPINGPAFQIGEQVTVFTYGKGTKSPVHLILNTTDNPGEGGGPDEDNLGKVMKGEAPPVRLKLGDEVPVLGEGTGHNGLGVKLADRLTDSDPDNDTIIVAIVETTLSSRNLSGELDGNVRVIDFAAIHLDAVIPATVPKPSDPSKTINIELLVGTVVQRIVSGAAGTTSSGTVNGPSITIPMLAR